MALSIFSFEETGPRVATICALEFLDGFFI
jgi:hypothetical protein